MEKVREVNFFDVHSVRMIRSRSKHERLIEQAAWDGENFVILQYDSRKVCDYIHKHLHNLGFTVERIHSQNYGQNFWFRVSW